MREDTAGELSAEPRDVDVIKTVWEQNLEGSARDTHTRNLPNSRRVTQSVYLLASPERLSTHCRHSHFNPESTRLEARCQREEEEWMEVYWMFTTVALTHLIMFTWLRVIYVADVAQLLLLSCNSARRKKQLPWRLCV